jgi:hypothetical protein
MRKLALAVLSAALLLAPVTGCERSSRQPGAAVRIRTPGPPCNDAEVIKIHMMALDRAHAAIETMRKSYLDGVAMERVWQTQDGAQMTEFLKKESDAADRFVSASEKEDERDRKAIVTSFGEDCGQVFDAEMGNVSEMFNGQTPLDGSFVPSGASQSPTPTAIP